MNNWCTLGLFSCSYFIDYWYSHGGYCILAFSRFMFNIILLKRKQLYMKRLNNNYVLSITGKLVALKQIYNLIKDIRSIFRNINNIKFLSVTTVKR